MSIGTGQLGQSLSRAGTAKRSDGDVEMGTLDSSWSGTAANTSGSESTTPAPNDVPTSMPSTSGIATDEAGQRSIMDGPPLPPRPLPTIPDTESALLTHYDGPPLGAPLPPPAAATPVSPLTTTPMVIDAPDIPPPAYEPQTSPGASGSTAQSSSPQQTGSQGTMDFDSFMRAQQHKMEYKLMLERTGQLPPDHRGEMEHGPVRSATDQAGQGQWASGTTGGASWLPRESPDRGGGGGSQRRRRGSF